MEKRQKRTRHVTPDTLDDIPQNSRQRRNSTSSAESSAFKKMTEIMSNLLQSTQNRSGGEITKGEVVPFFDPEDKQLNAKAWCAKVDKLAQVFHWNKDQTIYFAISK